MLERFLMVPAKNWLSFPYFPHFFQIKNFFSKLSLDHKSAWKGSNLIKLNWTFSISMFVPMKLLQFLMFWYARMFLTWNGSLSRSKAWRSFRLRVPTKCLGVSYSRVWSKFYNWAKPWNLECSLKFPLNYEKWKNSWENFR